MVKMRRITSTEDALLKRRLLSALPASRFEMETLSQLTDIKVTRQVPSAAVECRLHPRLLINPDFVQQYCPRDEHLFLLVMHELLHVQLAHTRMYPRMTKLQNIALDAIINAMLLREFDEPEYLSFFSSIYPADSFPGCLLRPPEGWPYRPVYPDVGPPGTGQLLASLYPPGNMSFYSMPLYEEVLSLLLRANLTPADEEAIFLIGGHGEMTHDPIMRDYIKQVSAKWSGFPGMGGNGGRGTGRQYAITPATSEMRGVFARTLRRTLTFRSGRENTLSRTKQNVIGGNGVIPNPYDRLATARRLLDLPNTLWAQNTQVNVRQKDKPARAFVYLDVSGSMNDCLPYLLSLLLPYVANGRAEVFQFSTIVKPLSFSDLRRGQMNTSGGTNINPVLDHLIKSTPLPRRVLILTDGEVGSPHPKLAEQYRELGTQMVLVLPHNGNLNPRFADCATSVVRLPRY